MIVIVVIVISDCINDDDDDYDNDDGKSDRHLMQGHVLCHANEAAIYESKYALKDFFLVQHEKEKKKKKKKNHRKLLSSHNKDDRKLGRGKNEGIIVARDKLEMVLCRTTSENIFPPTLLLFLLRNSSSSCCVVVVATATGGLKFERPAFHGTMLSSHLPFSFHEC
ncbi:hypothetical protein M0802_010804 [Mischocyttarus mexicanus]|nr:hypothetical protein M0802_010804 [Mischocyttarus mexicanus]